MAGTIFGLPLSQQFDIDGDPIAGGKLYLYEAGTTTPVDVFEDFGLSVETSNPVEADASGRIPQFWLDDGSYRARFTTADGVVVFDLLSVTAIGASSGEGGGGSSGVSENSVFQTGDIMWQPRSGTRTGWVRANARTIGSAASGATERANADTQALYEHLWTTYSNSLCPVTGGRGGSASADFAANKPIATLDMRSKGPFGLDGMGNDAAGVSGGSDTAATALGAATSTAILAHTHGAGTFEAATHTHTQQGTFTSGGHSVDHSHLVVTTGVTSSDGAHTHSYTKPNDPLSRGDSGSNNTVFDYPTEGSATTGSAGSHSHTTAASGFTGGVSTDHTHNTTISGATTASGALAVSGTSDSTGSGSSFSLLNPMRAGTWYFRL